MMQTQQLSQNTLLIEMSGHFHSEMAKELALSVFRSHRLGFTTFLFDLNHVFLMDERASQDLVRIGEGLQKKGSSYRVLGSPSPQENCLNFGTHFAQFPEESWN